MRRSPPSGPLAERLSLPLQVGMGRRAYRPLRLLLVDVWKRYGKPIILWETSAEGSNLDNWLAYVAHEVQSAQDAGVPVLGICIYPVMDYPGWLVRWLPPGTTTHVMHQERPDSILPGKQHVRRALIRVISAVWR